MATYTYSITGDFRGVVPKYEQLHEEIVNEPGITKTLVGVSSSEDIVDIIFERDLSDEEQTRLNDLVAAHVPITECGVYTTNINTSVNIIEDSTYKVVATFLFSGLTNLKIVSNIKIVSVMLTGGTSYDVLVRDVSNNTEICYVNLSNTDEQLCDLGTLSNLPNDSAIFEVYVKVIESTTVHIKNINICHN